MSGSVGLVAAAGWALLHLLWQGAVVAGVLAVVLRRMGPATPERRYAAAVAAVVVLLVLPLATVVLLATGSGGPGAETGLVAPAVGRDMAEETMIGRTFDLIASSLPFLTTFWLVGVTAMALRWMGGHLLLARLRTRDVRPPSPDVEAALRRAAARMGVRREVGLRVSSRIGVPAVVGLRRPAILLPERAVAELAPARLEAVLAHELAHVARWDGAVNLVQVMAETLFFHCPAVWWASAVARRERERCCDARVVRAGADPVAYARTLAELERLRGRAPRLALAAAGGELVERVRSLVCPAPAEAVSVRRIALPIIVGAMALAAITNVAVTPSAAASAARAPVVVSASDPAGEFTLRLVDRRVAGATVGRVPVGGGRLRQVRDSVYFLSPAGRPEFAVEVRRGGITWRPRNARTGRNL